MAAPRLPARLPGLPALLAVVSGVLLVVPGVLLQGLCSGPVQAQEQAQLQADPHLHHHHPPQGPASGASTPALGPDPLRPEPTPPQAHADHSHDLGPAGRSYDLRWLDAMVQHHIGALRMSEFVFDAGAPGVGALARSIWSDQAQEIRAMGQWRRAWYPEAPVTPVALRPGGDPDNLDGLQRMSVAQMEAMRMVGPAPSRTERVHWFLERMLHHHGAALQMAHDALRKTANPTIRRLARQIIVNQRGEIIQLRRMLHRDGIRKPGFDRYDALFVF